MLMTGNRISLEQAFDQLAESGWVSIDHCLPIELWQELAQLIDRRNRQGDLIPAKIGGGHQAQRVDSIRGDSIQWLNSEETEPAIQQLLKFLEQLMLEMNQQFYAGLRRFEVHFALYPPGTSYAKHLDQSPGSGHRKVTFILYLNENWQVGDGGELSLYSPEDDNLLLTQIQPLGGRIILFQTELFPHQVEAAQKARKSITGWFRNDAL